MIIRKQGTVFNALLVVTMLCIILLFMVDTTYAATDYLKEAQAKYNVNDALVFEARSDDEIWEALSDASYESSDTNKAIVHVPSGSYKVSGYKIPENVVFVAEKDVTFTAGSTTNQLIKVAGSIYGGSYDGAKKATCVLYFDTVDFSNNNGIIEKVTVTNAKKEGIIAMGAGCRNGQVLNCVAKNNVENGICIQKDAHMKLISGCNSSNNRYSGVNISHANVGVIDNCTINNNGDKAVSTNSDPLPGYNQPGCTIDAITNCSIKGNKTNGVYIKPKCTLKKFTGNRLINNKDGIVASAKTAAGTKGKSVIKGVSNNVFSGNKNSQICSGDKGAIIYIVKGNTIKKGKDSGIYVKNKAVLKITGNGNIITQNKKAGISVVDRAKLYITKKGNTISKNRAFGIYANRKAKVVAKGVKFVKNKKNKTYKAGGAKIVLKK